MVYIDIMLLSLALHMVAAFFILAGSFVPAACPYSPSSPEIIASYQLYISTSSLGARGWVLDDVQVGLLFFYASQPCLKHYEHIIEQLL